MKNPLIWNLRDRTLTLGPRPEVMGILNVTPDSFSDGGQFASTQSAVSRGLKMIEEGATILDIGGESSRPRSTPISAEEELRRVLPVVQELAKQSAVPLSVDTVKPEVARACLQAGAHIINDIRGFRDPSIIEVAAKFRASVVVMHMQGEPATMQDEPRYEDVVREVGDFFEQRLHDLEKRGVSREAVCLDPGFGFGKTLEHNLELLANLGEFARFGRPICLGVSRKGFIGTLCGRSIEERMPGSLAVACFAASHGEAHVLRVHDVAATRDAAVVLEAIERSRR
jgi:dihydropteroate synthase